MGPMAGTVEDAALALAAMCDFEAPSFDRAVSDFRVGICRTQFFEHLDTEVRPLVEDALAGLQVQELQLPHLAEGLAAQQVITAAEAAAYHHRWLESQPDAYDPAVRARLDAARNVDGADYVQALRVRGLAAEEMAAALQQVDVLASPTVPIPAPRFDAVEVEVEDGRLTVLGAMIRNTAAANVSGFPAISLPCGSTAAGLPVGVQLIGRPWQEGRLLEIARWFEERLPA